MSPIFRVKRNRNQSPSTVHVLFCVIPGVCTPRDPCSRRSGHDSPELPLTEGRGPGREKQPVKSWAGRWGAGTRRSSVSAQASVGAKLEGSEATPAIGFGPSPADPHPERVTWAPTAWCSRLHLSWAPLFQKPPWQILESRGKWRCSLQHSDPLRFVFQDGK